MVQAENLDTTLVYTYNTDGLRVAQAYVGTPGAQTYVWDWATGVPEMLSDGRYTYLVGLDTVGWHGSPSPMGQIGWTYALPDALGSVRQEADANGGVTAAREWSPYGEELGGAQTGLGFTGEWFDAGVGLTYLRARWYDGASGRFTSQDTWEGDYARPQSLNAWAYVEGNPLTSLDPTGHGPQPPLIVSGPDIPLPAWDERYSINQADKRKAEQAYYHLIADPPYFVNLSLNPAAWAESDEIAYLELFTQYSVLHTFASTLLNKIVSERYGADFARELEDARPRDPRVQLFTAMVFNGPALAEASWDLCYGKLSFTYESLEPDIAPNSGLPEVESLTPYALSNGVDMDTNKILTSLTENNGLVKLDEPPSVETLAELQGKMRGGEFTLVIDSNGNLYMTYSDSLGRAPAQTNRIVAHTHLYSLKPSNYDIDALKNLGQEWSFIVTSGGEVIKFYNNGHYEAPSYTPLTWPK